MNEALIGELRQEAATTRRVLERVPADKLGWKPHEKSMTLGELARHTADVPGQISGLAQMDVFDVANANFAPASGSTVEEILGIHDSGVTAAAAFLAGLTPESAAAIFMLKKGDATLMAMPRGAMVRALMLNHWYHHRGQLSVYLRLLDVPVPVIYGRSADENPFG